MAVRGAVTLMKNGSATSSGQTWPGGRATLVVMATAFATTTKLQMQGQDGSTWIDVQTVSANGLTALDLPAGMYRMSLSGGSPSGMYADLVGVIY